MKFQFISLLGDLLKGRDDQVSCITFGCYATQFEAWIILIVVLLFRRIRKAIYHNIHQSLIKNIPYIVFAGKMKYSRLKIKYLRLRLKFEMLNKLN